MEVNTDQLNQIGKGYLFRACQNKGVSHCLLDLAEAGRDMGKLYSRNRASDGVEMMGGIGGEE